MQHVEYNRRHLLRASLACGMGVVTGCHDSQPSQPQAASGDSRAPIALRILYVGDPNAVPIIQRGWSSVSEQPITIQVVPLSRQEIPSLDDLLVDGYSKCDVAVIPLTALSTVFHEGLAVDLGDAFPRTASEAIGELYPAVQNASATLGGKNVALPLGAKQLCFVAADSVERIDSWEAYDDLVQSWDGKASEPTAKGWVAASYLARCTTIRDWLFDRDTFEPLLSQPEYIDALTLMVKTCNRYRIKGQTPSQVWASVSQGELKGGLAMPPDNALSLDVLTALPLPGKPDSDRVLLDAFSPVATMAATCRQTEVARQFMIWLSGGEGSESVRSQVFGLGRVRMPTLIAKQADANLSTSAYQKTLAAEFSNPVTLPCLKVLQGERYYSVLDHQVSLAIAGGCQPQDALLATCKEWNQLTQQIGRDDQCAVWKEVNGMRG